MTDLLPPRPSSRTRRQVTAAAAERRRPLSIGAALAGLAAPATALLLLWSIGLVGWFAADGGAYGTTRSVLRVAADGWLLAHGAHLDVGRFVVTASPLGLTVACALLTFRYGRWAGRTCEVDDLRSVGQAAVVLSGVYAVVAMLTALLASAPRSEPGLGLAFLGGAGMGLLAGGAGLLRGAGLAGDLRARLPLHVLSVGYAATATTVLLLAAGLGLAAVGLAVHGSAAANIVETLGLDLTGGLLSFLLLLALVPNIALLGAAYLLGPGFAMGVGTVVSPGEVALGPLPALPVLAALPSDGWTPAWAAAFLAVPVAAAAGAAWWTGRVLPQRSWQVGAARGLGAGVAAAVVLAVVGLVGRWGRRRGQDGPAGAVRRGRAGGGGDCSGARRADRRSPRHLVDPSPRRRRGHPDHAAPGPPEGQAAHPRTSGPVPAPAADGRCRGDDRGDPSSEGDRRAPRPGPGGGSRAGHRSSRREVHRGHRAGASPAASVACAGAPHPPSPSGAPRRPRLRGRDQPAGRCSTLPPTRRTAPRSSPSAPTAPGVEGLARAERAGVPTFVRRVADHADRAAWDAALTDGLRRARAGPGGAAPAS